MIRHRMWPDKCTNQTLHAIEPFYLLTPLLSYICSPKPSYSTPLLSPLNIPSLALYNPDCSSASHDVPHTPSSNWSYYYIILSGIIFAAAAFGPTNPSWLSCPVRLIK